MTAADAQRWLERACAYDQPPALTSYEVYTILNRARVVDLDGLVVGDTGYTPTWDLNRAAAEAWEAKAARASGAYYDWGSEGASLRRSQVYEHCADMAKRFRRKVHGSVGIAGVLSTVSGYEEA